AAQFEPRQAFNARRGEQIAPFADGVIVEQKGLGDLLATPALVQQQDRIGPTRDPMLRQTIPRQRSQVRPFFRRQKAAPNHPLKTNPKSPATQQLSQILDDSGYILKSRDDARRVTEVAIAVKTLNRMRDLGQPICVRVA